MNSHKLVIDKKVVEQDFLLSKSNYRETSNIGSEESNNSMTVSASMSCLRVSCLRGQQLVVDKKVVEKDFLLSKGTYRETSNKGSKDNNK